ncbi:ribbon-helix-helix domain-containing protein [Sulfolobus sp. E11-6]|uniref:ribbon-helix-helix domain-containing protein n=1 Tax=Sulfolobus sp. E11-6 TaxID=2663020 RepID=UPI001296E91E|nr:ribbon-helix-helix domain-containing protein [Sulfolobus sp. E11-6]QGA67419.1 CopG family transcriptional regulator [Sulfolobus sp. E11-6]QGA69582.1 CopG family transcriptional regulator [Sulfolobus sp. E11-6]QGA87221.1 putative transcriptional regulator [Sulfolobus spindle-shaped virus SSV19]
MPKKDKIEWVGVKIPKSLADQIDEILKMGKAGYTSRQEFVIDAVRRRIEELTKS